MATENVLQGRFFCILTIEVKLKNQRLQPKQQVRIGRPGAIATDVFKWLITIFIAASFQTIRQTDVLDREVVVLSERYGYDFGSWKSCLI